MDSARQSVTFVEQLSNLIFTLIEQLSNAIFSPPIFAACLAAVLSGYLITRWKSREDAVEKRLDELINKIEEVADTASDYWLLESTNSSTKMIGVKVVAGIVRLDGLRSALRDMISAPATTEISNVASRFFRSCTGGDFGVHNRVVESIRAQEIILVAAEFCVVVRTARMRDLRGWRRRRS